jgi:putative endonuclease
MSTERKRYVYVLRSLIDPERHYVGMTADVRQRLAWHNGGQSPHTAKRKPWELLIAIEFKDQATGGRFEKYLKSGSGRAFTRRHFGTSRC